jgi:hypothetical protein
MSNPLLKKLSSIKNAVEKLVLERRLVCKKKEKNCVKCGCRCKNVDAYEINAQYRRILVTPLRTNALTYLRFIFLTLQIFTKLKT